MPDYLSKVVYLTDAQYAILNQNHNTTIGGHKFDPNALYITDTAGDASTVNGHTVNADVPFNAIFTDTNKYHTSGSWDGMTYTASAVNDAGELSFTLPVITAAKGGTGKTSLIDSMNALINSLSTGDSSTTANDYIITQYVNGGTTTSTYHRRKASKVVNADLVKLALSATASSSNHSNQFLRKDGSWQAPPYPVTSVNGSTGAVTISADSLGLSSAMHFRGTVTTVPDATAAATFSGYAAGDVILGPNNKEYVYNKGSNAAGSSWVELGSESSFKIKQTAINSTTGTAETTAVTNFLYSFAQDADGVVSVKNRPLPVGSSSVTGIVLLGASGGAAAFSHTHTTTMTQTGTSQISLAASTTYTLTAGGTSVIFKTPADTKNTAGSTTSTSKLFLIGATTQTASAQTYSSTYTFEEDGAFSAKNLGVNYGTTANKVTIQWNNTDSSLDFVFA